MPKSPFSISHWRRNRRRHYKRLLRRLEDAGIDVGWENRADWKRMARELRTAMVAAQAS
jgi:hypothetical protein